MSREIIPVLMRLGPASAEDVAKDLGVSQPTVSRMISANAEHVLRAGGSKNTIYGAARRIRQLPESVIPVFRINEDGQAEHAGSLGAVYPEGFLWSGNMRWPLDQRSKLYFHSIPYFIHDARPQGFMGRNFARLNADLLGVPSDPARWSDDDVVVAMAILGDDLAGDLIVGEAAYRRFADRQPEIIRENAIAQAYVDLAQRSLSMGIAGSSAAGEFPKFTVIRERGGLAQHAIVKFSGSGGSPAEQRWADLLRCEAHASAIISGHIGIEAAESVAFTHDGRTFIESTRFDRVGLAGRRSMCSLGSLDAELLGMGDPAWDKAADKLLQLRVIDADSASAMRRTWYFGKLIGNSDMHAGNLSFRLVAPGKVALCPIYDMLPMRYAPLRGGELPEVGQESLYTPLPGHEEEFSEARRAAARFWEAVVCDEAISPGFREIAETWCSRLAPIQAPRPV